MKNYFVKILVLSSLLLLVNFSLLLQDGKAQWVQVSQGMGANRSIGGLGGKDSIIIASPYDSFGYGVYRSTNNGDSWSFVNDSISRQSTGSIIAKDGNFMSAYAKVYLSTNDGANWNSTYNNAGWYTPYRIFLKGNSIFVISQITNNPIFRNDLYRSTDNGLNWTLIFPLNEKTIYSSLVNGDNIYFGTYYNGILRSSNSGANWMSANTGLTNLTVLSLAASGKNIFAGTLDSGVFLSTNNGDNWYAINNGLLNRHILTLGIKRNTIFAGTKGKGIYASSNNGTTWVAINEGFNPDSLIIRNFLISDNYIFAGTDKFSVWRRPINEITNIGNISDQIPQLFSLSQNYPNPFNPTTKISFSLPLRSFVKLIVYDSIGKEAASLVNENLNAGSYEYEFNGEGLSSGVYFYKLETGSFSETKKMVLLK